MPSGCGHGRRARSTVGPPCGLELAADCADTIRETEQPALQTCASTTVIAQHELDPIRMDTDAELGMLCVGMPGDVREPFRCHEPQRRRELDGQVVQIPAQVHVDRHRRARGDLA